MIQSNYLRYIKSWIKDNDIIISSTIEKDNQKYIRCVNFTKWKKFELKKIDEKLFLKKLRVEERTYLRECERINEVYKEEMLNTLEKFIEQELGEELVSFWTRSTGPIVQKNIDNSYVILKQKFKKKSKETEYNFLELLVREIELKYNSWLSSDKSRFKIYITRKVETDNG